MSVLPSPGPLAHYNVTIRTLVETCFAKPETDYVVFAGIFEVDGATVPLALFTLRTRETQAVPLESIVDQARSEAVCATVAAWMRTTLRSVNPVSAESAVLDALIRAGEQCDEIQARGGAGFAVSYAFKIDPTVNLN